MERFDSAGGNHGVAAIQILKILDGQGSRPSDSETMRRTGIAVKRPIIHLSKENKSACSVGDRAGHGDRRIGSQFDRGATGETEELTIAVAVDVPSKAAANLKDWISKVERGTALIDERPAIDGQLRTTGASAEHPAGVSPTDPAFIMIRRRTFRRSG